MNYESINFNTYFIFWGIIQLSLVVNIFTLVFVRTVVTVGVQFHIVFHVVTPPLLSSDIIVFKIIKTIYLILMGD